MLKRLISFWNLIEKKQRKKIIKIQVFVIFLAFIEIITIGSVAAFLNLVIDNKMLINVARVAPFLSEYPSSKVLLLIAMILIVIISIGSFIAIFIFNKSIKLSINIGHYISCELMEYYLTRNWLYHTQKNSSSIINNIIGESGRVANSVIRPFILATSKLILMVVISISIFIYNPLLTSLILTFFIVSYIIISKVVRSKLIENSFIITKSSKERIQSVNESIDNIKMVILNDKRKYFLKRFSLNNLLISERVASNMILGVAPRYIMEWLAFVSMILIIIVSLVLNDDLSEIIPLLTIYGLAAFKILPSLQSIYASISTIKGNISALDLISSELTQYKKVNKVNKVNENTIDFNEKIVVDKAKFRYPGKEKHAIYDLTVEIKKNQTIGIVGESGSGKSTLIDILCGLITIDSGSFRVDGVELNNEFKQWQRDVSYVPQSISLSDASIAENIAYGVEYSNIDWNLLGDVIRHAYLEDLIETLDDGFDTIVGEKGVQLSGGQRQRIGIARALYKKSNVLILDEATSALDGITENKIMQAINNLSGKMTIIIIAHRLKTIKNCDCIYMLKEGRLVDSNTYEGLLKTNREFQEMEKYA